MVTSCIEGLREWFANMSLFADGYINVNLLNMASPEYTIDEVPTAPIIKRYTDGSAKCKMSFVFASAESYSRDAIENLKACGFYENLINALDTCNANENLPELPNGCSALKVEAVTNGYSFTSDIQENVQRYQIQCKLTYIKR